ncbi:polysaccharide deacetylase family protein [Paenibacillus sp. HWE-109]|uniref:polysaccharide deacetylase family protein n=1 Tax=Paenibacillus sp. HWE-109 TaxID=1306526 RepID=UPI001EDE98FB|nr:polysaccharide deacetylase family protein [Paenibacillus sp. HWE-109]UKS29267.1 polysaccharide deacetylase family protein [Paenibacillus sp. HWE-109]
MKIRLNRFPDGKDKAVTLSYDDGRVQDRALVEILNRHGLKSTFHLNSSNLDKEGFIRRDEVAALFQGHEIAIHTVTHPHLTEIPRERLIMEIMEDRSALEELAGYPVRGMSYPFGTTDSRVVEVLSSLGIAYSRTTESHLSFKLPNQFLQWGATCHHNNNLLQRTEEFLNRSVWHTTGLLYVWGHSYEFDNDSNWELMESFGKLLSAREDVWFATNIEIYDYMNAVRSLQLTVNGKVIYNPSAIPVWISVNQEAIKIKSGEMVRF